MDDSQLLKGVLDVAVLAVIERQDAYGYAIVRQLREAGLDGVGDASVYGTLRRLFQGGFLSAYVVASDEGPHRKYYGLTPAGRAELEQGRMHWNTFAGALDDLLDTRRESIR